MAAFFYICEYLSITPQEFFDTDSQQPAELRQLNKNLKKLDKKQFDNISEIVASLVDKK